MHGSQRGKFMSVVVVPSTTYYFRFCKLVCRSVGFHNFRDCSNGISPILVKDVVLPRF